MRTHNDYIFASMKKPFSGLFHLLSLNFYSRQDTSLKLSKVKVEEVNKNLINIL